MAWPETFSRPSSRCAGAPMTLRDFMRSKREARRTFQSRKVSRNSASNALSGSDGEIKFPKVFRLETEQPFCFGRVDTAPIAGQSGIPLQRRWKVLPDQFVGRFFHAACGGGHNHDFMTAEFHYQGQPASHRRVAGVDVGP